MRRVLMVTTIGFTLERFLRPFAVHFRERGMIVDGVASQLNECPDLSAAFDTLKEVPWSRNPLAVTRNARSMLGLRDFVRRGNYDIVHVHTPIAAFLTRLSLRKLRKRSSIQIIYTAHGFHFHKEGSRVKNALFVLLEKLAGRWTDFLIVINKEDLLFARRYRIVPPDRIAHFPGIGIDVQSFSPANVSMGDVARVRRELGLSESDQIFLVVAEFHPRKRHADILEAFSRLQRPNCFLVLAGMGKLNSRIQVKIARLGLTKQVLWAGFRSDIQTLMSISTAVVLPSEREGLPRSIMEALCLGTPVIGSDIRGTRDLLEGGCGLLVRLGDVEGFARAMGWVIDNPQLSREMVKRGREKILHFGLEVVISECEKLYEKAFALKDAGGCGKVS